MLEMIGNRVWQISESLVWSSFKTYYVLETGYTRVFKRLSDIIIAILVK
jgi:hypothetical protein